MTIETQVKERFNNLTPLEKEILQDLFTKIFTGLTEQKWQVSNSEDKTRCLFRGFNNTKCAIGQLIPDGNYYPELERYTFPYYLNENNLLLKAIKFYKIKETYNLDVEQCNRLLYLLKYLQHIHDTSYSHVDLKQKYIDIATEWALKI